MAVSARSWLTVAEAQAHLKANVQALDTTRIERLVDAACRAVETYLERGVIRRPYDERHDGQGRDFLRPLNPPAAVSAVYVDETRAFEAASLLPASAWWTSGGDEGQGDGGSTVELADPTPKGRGIVRIVYEGGWSYTLDEAGKVTADRIPADLRLATLLVLQTLHDKGEGKGLLGQATVSAGVAGSVTPISTIELTAAIPKEAKELLDPYRSRRRDLWL